MSTILAFDPGGTSCGFAWLETRGGSQSFSRPEPINVSYVDCGNIPSTHAAIGEFLRRNPVDLVAIEKVEGHAFNKKRKNRETGEEEIAPMPVKHLLAAAGIATAISWLCTDRGIRTVEMTAGEWRKMVCGNRSAKDTMIKLAVERYVHGWPARSNMHNRDAGGLGLAAAWHVNGRIV